MNVLANSRYLVGFATREEIATWTPAVRAALVDRLSNAPASPSAWGALVELLFHCPEEESIEPMVDKLAASVRAWDWRIRRLDDIHPALCRDGGVAMTLVGHLVLRDFEDLHGLRIRAACNSPRLDGVRGLTLRKVDTFARYVARIAQNPSLGGLESFECSKVHLGSGIAEVFDRSQLVKLTTLELNSVDLVRADLEDLSRAAPSELVERLSLSGNLINTDDLGVMLSSDAYPRLKVLDVSHTSVHSRGLEAIVASRRLPALEKILLFGTAAAKSVGDELLL